jgi:hypothetical protein
MVFFNNKGTHQNLCNVVLNEEERLPFYSKPVFHYPCLCCNIFDSVFWGISKIITPYIRMLDSDWLIAVIS